MDPKTSSQSVSGSHKVDPDVDNLSDNFAGLVCKQEGFHDVPIVIFDLDTTRRDTKICEIFQIAAWCKGSTFNECILPENINEINGFRVVGGTLHHYGNEVNALSPIEALVKFLDFLGNKTGQTRGVLLAAHNCFSRAHTPRHAQYVLGVLFDPRLNFHDHMRTLAAKSYNETRICYSIYSMYRYIIVRLMKRYGLFDNFQALVLGFIDTVPVFKAILPERPRVEGSFSLKNLATDYLGQNAYPVQQHAVVNVFILVSLLQSDTIGCTDAMLMQHAEGLDESIRFIGLKQAFAALSTFILKKIARAGISSENLIEVYNANGAVGVSNFLQGVNLQPATIEIINATLPELLGNGNAN